MAAILEPTTLPIDLDDVRARLAEGWTLPAEFYTDPGIHRLEMKAVFRASWILAGAAIDLPEAGDFLTLDVGDVPVVVVRNAEGALNAFINICRHRGHAVARGRGNARTLRCLYHGWTYDLDGRLRLAPQSKGGGLDLDRLGLVPAPLETWNGLIFVSVEPALSLKAALGELPGIMDTTSWDHPFAEPGRLSWRRRVEHHYACNWKIAWENSIECYHCPTVHAATIGPISQDMYRVIDYDRGFYHLYFWPDGKHAATPPEERDWSRRDAAFYYLFPTNSVIHSDSVTLQRLMPLGPERSVSFRDYYAPADADFEAVDREIDESNVTLNEDVEVVGAVQANLRSGALRYGRTVGGTETNIRHSQMLLWQALEPALLSAR